MNTLTPAYNKIEVAKSFDLPAIAFCAAVGSESDNVFVGCSDFAIYRVNTAAEKPTATPLTEKAHSSYVTGMVCTGDNVVSAGYDGRIIWWDSESGTARHRQNKAHKKWIRRLAISPDGKTVASVGDDMVTRLWNADTSELISEWQGYDEQTPHGYPSMLYAAAFSADGLLLATGNRTGNVLIRSVKTGETVGSLECPIMYTWDPRARRHSIGGIRSVAFSGDSHLLAVGGMGKVGNIDHLGGKARVEIFDWKSGERKHEIESEKFKGLVERIQFGPDDKWVAAAGGDHGGFVNLYSTSDGAAVAEEKAPMHVHDFEFDAAQSRMIAVGHNKGCVVQLS